MPSPIAHVAAGYAVYRLVRRQWPASAETGGRAGAGLLAATLALSLLPDVDSALGFAAGDMGRFHNQVTHSLVAGAGAALGVGALVYLGGRRRPAAATSQATAVMHRPVRWFLLVLACYSLHVTMDYFTVGRGVMALWPLTEERFLAPVPLFVGLQWSDGLWSAAHLWTALTEISLILLAGLGWSMWSRARPGGGDGSSHPVGLPTRSHPVAEQPEQAGRK